MKIGICTTDPTTIKSAYNSGLDFVEVSNWTVAKMDDAAFNELLALKSTLPEGFFYACNGLVPSDLRLTGPDVDYEKIREFSENSFAKLAKLGVKMLVFGSSKAKEVPEGFDFDEAMEQLVKVTRIFSDAAKKHGQQVCIEPLRTTECNIINTAEDSARLAEMTGCDNVGAHVDYFHLMQNGEKMSKLEALAKDILHTHIASPCKRTLPSPDDGADYGQFINYLRKGGYDATVSFEGGGEKTAETLTAFCTFMKSL
ncbi:MAG: sugar phosphate isomerase/epimerase [Clostridia bacterium]|nr:sugar phosphate isomerase/epimerase [Clostridia bacterium]